MKRTDSPGERGRRAEDLAIAHLVRAGLRLLDRNVRAGRGEIDVIMRDGAAVVFVEVRFRRTARYGGAAETVGSVKQRRLITAAHRFLQAHRTYRDCPCRFDVVEILGDENSKEVKWIRDAFQA
ncbi:MAG: YraN family protein [Gammaproteobacteria bacterium]|nr:YraN family protein [Gammaproteobacteria bacterium]